MAFFDEEDEVFFEDGPSFLLGAMAATRSEMGVWRTEEDEREERITNLSDATQCNCALVKARARVP